jgi:hypothetical protein
MKFLLWALLLQEAPIEQEKARLRSKPPLTTEEKGRYVTPAAAPPIKPRASYTLAVIPLGFSDRAVAGSDLSKLFFGDVAAWFRKASGGKFELRGKVFAPATLAVERAAFVEKDLDRVLAGFAELAAFDGLAFVAAGPLGARGTPLWPHKESTTRGDREVDYVLLAEDAGDRALGIAAHETMHLLGFPDKYDDEKSLVDRWCIMGTGYNGRDPAPPCADCREKLGWTAPAELDPRRPAAVVLEPDFSRSLKVRLNADGTEYLLLEVRDRLFVWHAGGGRKIELVGRYPSESSDRLTPLSDPSFRGRTAGAWPAWITDVRLEDGKAWFKIGPSAPLTPLEEWRRAHVGKRLGD